MVEPKIVVVVMGQDCWDFLPMCLDSVKGADAVVYCDGGSNDEFFSELNKWKQDNDFVIDFIENEFSQDDKLMNGKQRNFYLDYLKKNYDGWWCLALDADEVVDDFVKVKETIKVLSARGYRNELYSPHMRHLVYNLRFEDCTVPEHFVHNRLFYVRESLVYPLGEHVVLKDKEDSENLLINGFTVWHQAMCNMNHVKKRFNKNINHSNVHNKEFLDWWYESHLLGNYPVKQFNPVELPDSILNYYGFERDKLYFKGRDLIESKHFIECNEWKKFFNPGKVLFLGCGMGARPYVMDALGVDFVKGIELSEWACRNNLYKNTEQGDVLSFSDGIRYDLVVAYDILEHLEMDDLNKALGTINNSLRKGGHAIISVPTIGDPNLEADPTHKIKMTKTEWKDKVQNAGFEIMNVPTSFPFSNQLIIGEKNE